MKIKELSDFIYENYFSQTGLTKENSYYSIKNQKKDLLSFAPKLFETIPDPSKTKELWVLRKEKKNQKWWNDKNNCATTKNYR